MKHSLITLSIVTAALFISYKFASTQGNNDAGDQDNKNRENWNGISFINQVPTRVSRPGTFLNTLWLWMTGTEERRPRREIVFARVSRNVFEHADPSMLRVTWLGHSTTLIEIGGKRFLTDPIWSRRCSPVAAVGPARFFSVPLMLEDLPRLDGVIISHDHYDHLDEATIRKLGSRDLDFYVPAGVGRHLRQWGISPERIHEFNWWDRAELDGGCRLIAAPARHFSGRGPFQKDRTLWASWIIEGHGHKVFFGGDGGYHPGFKKIGDEYGPFDVTMLEIGAYHPNWGDIHLGPEMALRAHQDLRGRALFPIHWGTFQLAMHDWRDPVERIRAGALEQGVVLLLPEPGRPVAAEAHGSVSGWWERM